MNDLPPAERPICDLSAALARMGKNRALLSEMIEIYLDDYPALLTRINTAAASGDMVLLLRSAHSLKGLAANFDGIQVIDAAISVDRVVRKNFDGVLGEELSNLNSAADELAERLREVGQKEDF